MVKILAELFDNGLCYKKMFNMFDFKEWIDKKSAEGRKHAYVYNKEQFNSVKPENTDYLLGKKNP